VKQEISDVAALLSVLLALLTLGTAARGTAFSREFEANELVAFGRGAFMRSVPDLALLSLSGFALAAIAPLFADTLCVDGWLTRGRALVTLFEGLTLSLGALVLYQGSLVLRRWSPGFANWWVAWRSSRTGRP
jgi:hypothetical protein